MITEDYVSFETAKLLKEKGFDESCYRQYYETHYGHEFGFSAGQTNSMWDDNFKRFGVQNYAAPTLQMAMKWLRENHNLYVTSVPNGIGENVFYMSIYRKYDYGWTHISDCFDEEYKEAEFSSPEEACDNGLQYCLENLI